MLKTKSFDLMDSDGINDLLDQYPLAEGASIFVSEGKICIPFEDGEPENDAQRIIRNRTEVNKMTRQIEIIERSNKELEIIGADLRNKFDTANADFKSAPNNKDFEKKKKELDSAISYNEGHIEKNIAEIERLQLSIKLLNNSL